MGKGFLLVYFPQIDLDLGRAGSCPSSQHHWPRARFGWRTAFLREALRVIKAGTDISGDVNRSLFWYRNEPLSAFGYKTAEHLVPEGRAKDVLRYVASLEAGATG